jgi:hypothetical protein
VNKKELQTASLEDKNTTGKGALATKETKWLWQMIGNPGHISA